MIKAKLMFVLKEIESIRGFFERFFVQEILFFSFGFLH
jgi:hypothetical protein